MKKSMIGKVILMDIPTLKSPRYALITDIDFDKKRYYIRKPKIGTLIRDLKLKRNSDFGPEKIAPNGSKPWVPKWDT